MISAVMPFGMMAFFILWAFNYAITYPWNKSPWLVNFSRSSCISCLFVDKKKAKMNSSLN